jgi:hypothetical protein
VQTLAQSSVTSSVYMASAPGSLVASPDSAAATPCSHIAPHTFGLKPVRRVPMWHQLSKLAGTTMRSRPRTFGRAALGNEYMRGERAVAQPQLFGEHPQVCDCTVHARPRPRRVRVASASNGSEAYGAARCGPARGASTRD